LLEVSTIQNLILLSDTRLSATRRQ